MKGRRPSRWTAACWSASSRYDGESTAAQRHYRRSACRAVPIRGLDVLAVGLDRFEAAVAEELDKVRGGGSVFKAVRGEYGGGKTFFARWLQERAKRLGLGPSDEVERNRHSYQPETNKEADLLEAHARQRELGCPRPLRRSNPWRRRTDCRRNLSRPRVTPNTRSRWRSAWDRLRQAGCGANLFGSAVSSCWWCFSPRTLLARVMTGGSGYVRGGLTKHEICTCAQFSAVRSSMPARCRRNNSERINDQVKPRAQSVQSLEQYPQVKEQNRCIPWLLRFRAYLAARQCRASVRW